MKTRSDPRHRRRQKNIKRLFAYSFQEKNRKVNQRNLIRPIIDHLAVIDKSITGAAPEFPLERLNRIDLAILRLAVFELLIEKKEPPKVIIDEAIELAKEFGSENSPGFINGALGAIVNNLKLTIKN
ncbi:MAG: transcription antitermination factor NusB [Candidatus Shapirobacteria bacterium]|nr:transcription antitermination factor NusB [Candidatus Shapirobacteria bacterium]MDD5074012.1 transcription antitermination factor NusB [Candidatus Shapirobacteria bacterium]MDD5481544.1 transcription antitermination factor NusB [Candidatus Shapirobacteria bacterium]